MRTFNALIFLFSCLCSCSTRSVEEKVVAKKDIIKVAKQTFVKDTIEMDDEETGISEPQYITDTKEMQILTLNDTLYKGDTLEMKFKVPHSKDLAITTPDDNFFFIVYAQSEVEKPSLVEWNTFATMDYLEVVTDKTKANLWDARVKENRIIFTKTGKYEIRLSENLETDDGTPVELKTVYYIHKRRKS